MLPVPDKWEWDVGCVLLQGDFPLQYSTLLDSTRNICMRPETSQKPSKLETALNKVNKEIKKVSDEISQQSYMIFV